MTLEQLFTLYNIVCDICKEYSRMTDGYIMATGDNVLDATYNIPSEMQNIINERQQYFAIKGKVTNLLKEKLLEEIEYE